MFAFFCPTAARAAARSGIQRIYLRSQLDAGRWARKGVFTGPSVKNSGSVARDHLANERTFLAWARTGMGFVGLGVAMDSLQRHNETRILTSDNLSQREMIGAYARRASTLAAPPHQTCLCAPSLPF